MLTGVTVLTLNGQVNYDDDEDWSQWNVTAKLRILTRPSDTHPMAPCFINPGETGSTATPVSSLAVSHHRTASTDPAESVACRTDADTINDKQPAPAPTVASDAFQEVRKWNKANKGGFKSSNWSQEDEWVQRQEEGMEAEQKVMQGVPEDDFLSTHPRTM